MSNERDRTVTNRRTVDAMNRQSQGLDGTYNDVPREDPIYGTPTTSRTNTSAGSGQAWTRWQNWVNVVLGIVLFVSPWYTVTWGYSTSSWNAWILGVLIVIMALAAAAAPRYPAASWINIFLGLWVFISPWLLGFTLLTGMAWTAWIIGGLVFLVAIWAVSQANSGASYSRSAI